MNIPETLTEMIETIQKSECAKCKFGDALITLRDMRDRMERYGKPEAPVINPPSQPVTQRNAAKPGKLQRKTAKEPAIKNSQRAVAHDNTDIVLNYVAAHPGCKVTEIIAGTGCDRNMVKYHLTKARKEGRAKVEGRTAKARWSMTSAPRKQLGKEDDLEGIDAGVNPPPADGKEKPFECEACGMRFHVKGSLLSHKQFNCKGKKGAA